MKKIKLLKKSVVQYIVHVYTILVKHPCVKGFDNIK